MNKVILSGNLCKEIELRKTTSGKSVTTNSIAVRREFKDGNGEYSTDFFNIVVWGQAAEYLSKYGGKGDRVELCGRVQNRTYQATDGTNREVTEIQVENISVFSNTKKEEPEAQEKENATYIEDIDSDLPF